MPTPFCQNVVVMPAPVTENRPLAALCPSIVTDEEFAAVSQAGLPRTSFLVTVVLVLRGPSFDVDVSFYTPPFSVMADGPDVFTEFTDVSFSFRLPLTFWPSWPFRLLSLAVAAVLGQIGTTE